MCLSACHPVHVLLCICVRVCVRTCLCSFSILCPLANHPTAAANIFHHAPGSLSRPGCYHYPTQQLVRALSTTTTRATLGLAEWSPGMLLCCCHSLCLIFAERNARNCTRIYVYKCLDWCPPVGSAAGSAACAHACPDFSPVFAAAGNSGV